MTPYYERGGITLFNGDCLEVMRTMQSESVDMVFTSPPYNLGVSSGGGIRGASGSSSHWNGGALAQGYEAHNDAMPWPEYVEWQKTVLLECWRILRPTGAIFYNHRPRIQDGILRSAFDLNPGLPVRQVIIWHSGAGINASPTHYRPTHEWIMVLAKPDFRLKSKAASTIGDVWQIPPDRINPHPAPFPIALPFRAIETTTAQIILDPFAGSGTTLMAAKTCYRQAIGIELGLTYCEQAAERLTQDVLPLAV